MFLEVDDLLQTRDILAHQGIAERLASRSSLCRRAGPITQVLTYILPVSSRSPGEPTGNYIPSHQIVKHVPGFSRD